MTVKKSCAILELEIENKRVLENKKAPQRREGKNMNQRKIIGEPVEGQAPTNMTADTKTANTSTTPASDTAPAQGQKESVSDADNPGNGSESVLGEYLAQGYYKGEGKGRYPDPSLVDYAEIIGKALAAGGVTATAFNRMVKTLKGAEKLSYEAQQGALKKLVPLVLKEKKAPALLREFVDRNRESVRNETDFAACLDHFRDVSVFLAVNRG